MVEILSIVEFSGATPKGETKPWKATCEAADGLLVEVALKAAGHATLGVKALAMEWGLANLAGDLGLPICKPHLVRLDADSLAELPDKAWAAKALAGNPIAFGSVYAGSGDRAGFSEWTQGYEPKGPWLNQAWHTAAFDAWTDNPDRKPSNANCLVRGQEFRIIDHEKCFPTLVGLVLFGKAAMKPWQTGGAEAVLGGTNHIFSRHLRAKPMPRQAITDAWIGLPKDLASMYGSGLPPEWADAQPVIQSIATAVADIQTNIDGCLDELQRCLS